MRAMKQYEAHAEPVRSHSNAHSPLLTQRLRIVPVQPQHLDALQKGVATLAQNLGARIPAGWPQSPMSLGFGRETQLNGLAREHWGMYFFLRSDKSVLVGSGGFKGPPRLDGFVEVEFEIAPAYRRQGFATDALMALVVCASARRGVKGVQADTLTGDRATRGVLRRAGLGLVAALNDSRQGFVSRWTLGFSDAPGRAAVSPAKSSFGAVLQAQAGRPGGRSEWCPV